MTVFLEAMGQVMVRAQLQATPTYIDNLHFHFRFYRDTSPGTHTHDKHTPSLIHEHECAYMDMVAYMGGWRRWMGEYLAFSVRG